MRVIDKRRLEALDPSGGMISHKYRGSCVAFSISKSVEPNEELKVGLMFSQVLSITDTTLRTLNVYII
jgi:hypothetical protein